MEVIARELQNRDYGILIITGENQSQPWLNFEAGALSKALDIGRVTPYLFDMKIADLKPGPLIQFQAREAIKEGTFRLMKDINRVLASPLSDQQILNSFDRNWPYLEEKLNKIKEDNSCEDGDIPNEKLSIRSEEEKIDELISIVRTLELKMSYYPNIQMDESRRYDGFDRDIAAQKIRYLDGVVNVVFNYATNEFKVTIEDMGIEDKKLLKASIKEIVESFNMYDIKVSIVPVPFSASKRRVF